MSEIIPVERIENQIYLIRGQKVMLDSDLARLYGVETRILNQAVKRNMERFPEDFMFKLTWKEMKSLRSQFVILDKKFKGRKHVKYLPNVFTEQGIAMLSSVVNSKKAIKVNIVIMRAFVRIRQFLSTHKILAEKIKELQAKTDKHDVEIQAIFEAIRNIINPQVKRKREIGFLR